MKYEILIFGIMKRIWFLIYLLPFLATAQLDFESYKGKLNFVDLPPVQEVVSNPFLEAKPKGTNNLRKLPSFRLNKENYREPVSVFEAMASSEKYVKSDIEISINPKEYGIYGNSNYSPDSSTKVTNSVYKDAGRGFFYSDSCPPYGICARCAPYRIGRY